MYNELNFDEKFKSLGEYYIIDAPLEIRKQIERNENIFIFLDEIKPYLEESFSDAELHLQMNYEPENNDRFIILRLDVSEDRFYNGIGDEISSLEFKLMDLEKELNVLREVLIMPGVIHV